MMNLVIPLAAVVSIAGAGALALNSGSTSSESRADCPGKVVCPISGELVCQDRCPVRAGEADGTAMDTPLLQPVATRLDPARADCPGLIDCPQTGEPVCEDECPLLEQGTATETVSAPAPPACCAVTD